MALCGGGFGFFQSPNNRAIISTTPRARSGGASGMLGTARLLGQSTGTALVALLFDVVGASAPVWALVIAAGVAVLAALVSMVRLAPQAKDRKSNGALGSMSPSGSRS
jgi:DHA2 family multidrug resistance protein-like MFS transporter